MPMEGRGQISSWLAFAVTALPALILLFAAILVLQNSEADRLYRLIVQGFGPLSRTVAVGVISSVAVVVLSISLASTVIGSWLRQSQLAIFALCVTGPLAITPLLLGSASFAFLWRTPFAEALLRFPLFSDHGPLSVATLDIVAQLVRYTPVATWLLVVTLLDSPKTLHQYAVFGGFGPLSLVRTEFLRRWGPLILIVAAFAFQDAFNDYLITYLSLRPSEATNTELISHFLNRSFVAIAVGRSATEAASALVGMSLISAIVSAVAFGLTSAVLLGMSRLFRVSFRENEKRHFLAVDPFKPNTALTWVQIAAFGVIVAVLSWKLFSLDGVRIGTLWEVRWTLAASLAVAFVCWCLAVLVNFLVREATSDADGSIERRFGVLAWICVSLGFIPPIGLAAAVYILMFYCGFTEMDATAAWFAGQVLRMFPLFVVLVIPTSFAVPDTPIWYLKICGVGFISRLHVLFLSPFVITHFALLFIGWNFVLNEGVISTVFQADIPALSEIVQRASSGRSAAYPIAASIAVLTAVMFGTLCLVWGLQSYRSWIRANARG